MGLCATTLGYTLIYYMLLVYVYLLLGNQACKGQAVELGVDGVASAGQHDGCHCSLEDGGSLGMAEEGDGFIEQIAGLDVGKYQCISITSNGRADLFDFHGFSRTGCLQIQWTVDDAGTESSRLSFFPECGVGSRIGEMAFIHLLGTVDKSNLGTFNLEGMTEINEVSYLFPTLLVGRCGDDGGICKEEQLVVFWQPGSRDMCQHRVFRQDSELFVQYGTQQYIRVQEALHDDVSLLLPYQSDSFPCCFFSSLDGHRPEAMCSGIVFPSFFRTDQYRLDESFFCCSADSLLCMTVFRPYHNGTSAYLLLFEKVDELSKVFDRLSLFWHS